MKVWVKQHWHWLVIAGAAGVAAIYLYRQYHQPPMESEPESEGEEFAPPAASPEVGGSTGGNLGPGSGFINLPEITKADVVPKEEEPEAEPEAMPEATDETELVPEPVTGGGFVQVSFRPAGSQPVGASPHVNPSIASNRAVEQPASISQNQPAPQENPQQRAGECQKAQNEMNRLQNEINGLQGQIAQLTNNIQAHPNAQQRSSWESQRNQIRANIDNKRGNVEQWHNVAQRAC